MPWEVKRVWLLLQSAKFWVRVRFEGGSSARVRLLGLAKPSVPPHKLELGWLAILPILATSMHRTFTPILISALFMGCSRAPSRDNSEVNMTENTAKTVPAIYPLSVNSLDGKTTELSTFKGKVLLIVNTASECGFTPQYGGLEALHEKFSARGFAVLGFPSNDFGGQEPGNAEQIATFCTNSFGVTFPMFEKTPVKGDAASPLYALLGKTLGAPKWNFHKYLIDKQGRPVESWPSATEPLSAEIHNAIERELTRP